MMLVIRRLSIDIALGAVVGAEVFAFVLDVEIKISTALLLAGTVWMIYITDHIADSFATKDDNHRHYFYYRHRKTLSAVAILICVANMYLLTLQSMPLLVMGAQLFFMVVIYLILTHLSTFFRMYLKEVSCALLYSAGISLPAVALAGSLTPVFYGIFLFYVFSAWINLLSISLFELDYDTETGFQSLAVSAGQHLTRWVLNLLFVSTAVLLLAAFRSGLSDTGILILGVIPAMQALILFKKQYFLQNERYRIAGDLLYLLPAIVFVIG